MLSASQYPIVPFANLITDLKNGVEIRTYAPDGHRYLRVSDLGQHGIENHNPRYVDVEEIPEKIRLTENSFLVSRSGSLGLVSVVENEIRDAILSSHIFKVNLDTTQVRPRYLEAVLRSQIGQVQFFRNNNGAVIPEISQSALKSILVVLPPPNIQNHIVTIMQSAYAQKARKEQEADALLESIDGYVLAELGIEMPTVEEKRCYVVRAGQFEGRLDPSAYRVQKSSSITAIHASKYETVNLRKIVNFRKELVTDSSELPYLGMKNVESNTGYHVHATDEKESFGSALQFQTGDVLFPKLAPYLNKVHLAEFDGVCSTEFCILETTETVANLYLFAFLRTQLVVNQTTCLMTGSLLPRLSTQDVERLPIPIPPIGVQSKIAAEVKQRLVKTKRLREEAGAVVEAAKEQVERILLQEESA